MQRFVKFGLAAACATVALGASANELTEDQARAAVETRQAVFKLMGWNMDPLGAMLRNRVPFDAERAALSGERLQQLAQLISDAFEADTREFHGGIETQARNGAWSNRSDFTDQANALVRAAANLQEVAASGDRAGTLRAVGQVGQACGSCHDRYRDD